MRSVNTTLIEQWLIKHSPYAMEKMAKELLVSETVIYKARRGRAPKREATRQRFAKGMGVSMDRLFPAEK